VTIHRKKRAGPVPAPRVIDIESECNQLEQALYGKALRVQVGQAEYKLMSGGTPGYLRVELTTGARTQGFFFPTALGVGLSKVLKP
jgi:hypothetical protein